MAYRAFVAEHMRQGLACALARKLQQTKRRKSTQTGFCAVAAQMLLQLRQHRSAVFIAAHVNEVSNHDAT